MLDPTATASTGPGPVTHLIQVHCDLLQHTVTVTRPRVSLKPGDTVVWSFTGLPEDWSPWIEFRHAENAAFSGPFTGLTQSSGGVWGVCKEEWPGTTTSVPFEYRASIQRGFGSGWSGPGSVLWSASAELDVLPDGIGQEVVYTVTVTTDDKPLLVVAPPGRELNPGDVMVWQFELPEGPGSWRPRIDFYRYDGAGAVPNRYLGPFAALSVEPGRIRGTGNNGVPGIYFFEVALVEVGTGRVGWVSSGDPVVDNRGTVVAPPD